MILVPPPTVMRRVCFGGITVVSNTNRSGEYSYPSQSSVSSGFSAIEWFIKAAAVAGVGTPVIGTRAATMPVQGQGLVGPANAGNSSAPLGESPSTADQGIERPAAGIRAWSGRMRPNGLRGAAMGETQRRGAQKSTDWGRPCWAPWARAAAARLDSLVPAA
jgi:hypothetical protein